MFSENAVDFFLPAKVLDVLGFLQRYEERG